MINYKVPGPVLGSLDTALTVSYAGQALYCKVVGTIHSYLSVSNSLTAAAHESMSNNIKFLGLISEGWHNNIALLGLIATVGSGVS